METKNTAVVLQAENLELTISDKNLGTLTTNAKDIKALVEQALPNYSIENYTEANIDKAKTDKAMLNNAGKVLNAKRLELEKEWNQPFLEFKDIISETVKLISETSSKIDAVVKESENKWKTEKKASIEVFWNLQDFKLVAFEKIFCEKWLNKTTKDKVIESEIETIINGIKGGLQTLGCIVTDDVETLKAMYLDNLDLNKTIQYANTIRENKEKMNVQTPPIEEIEVVVEEIKPEIAQAIIPAPEEEETLERTFKVIAPKSKMILLGNFMNDNGIGFVKV